MLLDFICLRLFPYCFIKCLKFNGFEILSSGETGHFQCPLKYDTYAKQKMHVKRMEERAKQKNTFIQKVRSRRLTATV